MSDEEIRVLLVDDHSLVREGIKASLSKYSDIRVVGEAGDGLEAIEKAALLGPNVILLDFSMPKMNGLEAAKILRKEQPQSQILVCSMHNRQEYLLRFLELGVKGYISKDAAPDELCMAVRRVHAGQIYVGAGIGSSPIKDQKVDNPVELLSKREQEVLILIAASSRSKDIAAKLGISTRTVEKHRSQIMKKLRIDNVAGLTRYALTFEMPNH